MNRLFAVIRSRGPAYDDSVALEAQVDWSAHAAFMNALVDNGQITLGGPLEGTRDVLLVMHASSESEISECLAKDPWARSGQLVVKQIHPWQLRLGALELPPGA